MHQLWDAGVQNEPRPSFLRRLQTSHRLLPDWLRHRGVQGRARSVQMVEGRDTVSARRKAARSVHHPHREVSHQSDRSRRAVVFLKKLFGKKKNDLHRLIELPLDNISLELVHDGLLWAKSRIGPHLIG